MSQPKEILPEDFLTRAERVRQLEVPDSNESMVVVKPNNQALGFRNNCYNDIYLSDKIDKLTFNNTVKKANKICENIWRAKKVEEEAEYSKYYRWVLYLAIFISLISFALLLLLIYGSGGNVLLYSSLVLICLAAILTLTVVVKSLFSQPHFIDLEESIIKGINLLLEEENRKIYGQRNLRWKMQDKCFWLELHIDSDHIKAKNVKIGFSHRDVVSNDNPSEKSI